MEFVDRLLQETEYLKLLEEVERFEQDRIFCRHGLEHLLDTARIAWIRCLDQKLEMEKEQLYLAALLHDIGRIWEYEKGIPHEEAGVTLAEKLLAEIQYPKEQTVVILDAIGAHRDGEQWEDTLGALLKWADKKSRNCFFCKAQGACKWSEERRNQTIRY